MIIRQRSTSGGGGTEQVQRVHASAGDHFRCIQPKPYTAAASSDDAEQRRGESPRRTAGSFALCPPPTLHRWSAGRLGT
jgi:hypothetical protein